MFKMIIADDERIIRETISSIIDWNKYDIDVIGLCQNGLEAYDMIVTQNPHIVLTDIRMPGMDGLELVRKIRSINNHIQFIILSGYSEFEYAKEAMKYGIKHYLLKPCNETQILSCVEACKKDYNEKFMTERVISNPVNFYISELERIASLFTDQHAVDAINQLELLISSIDEIKLCKQIANNLFLKLALHNHSISSAALTEWLSLIEEEQNLFSVKELILCEVKKILPESADQQSFSSTTQKILKYVNDNLQNDNLSLAYICKNYLYMNVDYVSKKFLKDTGIRFSTYLTNIRITKAKQLLIKNGQDKIQTVAEEVGFANNPQYFSQIFKKSTGMTPSAYISKYS